MYILFKCRTENQKVVRHLWYFFNKPDTIQFNYINVMWYTVRYISAKWGKKCYISQSSVAIGYTSILYMPYNIIAAYVKIHQPTSWANIINNGNRHTMSTFCHQPALCDNGSLIRLKLFIYTWHRCSIIQVLQILKHQEQSSTHFGLLNVLRLLFCTFTSTHFAKQWLVPSFLLGLIQNKKNKKIQGYQFMARRSHNRGDRYKNKENKYTTGVSYIQICYLVFRNTRPILLPS